MEYNPQSHMTPPPFNGVSVKAQTNAVIKRVYFRMFIGLLVSAFCALGVASSPALCYFFFGNKIMLIVMLVMAWVIPARMERMSTTSVFLLFLLFAALMGTWIAPIFWVYQLDSIAYTFFITAGTFGAMSVYGYFTKSDLTKFGTFLIMALFGLIIASIVNIFANSDTLGWVISVAGVLIFVGLTAWDTQQVKRMAAANLKPSLTDKLATMGAMNLYLDFINLFLYLLRFFGDSRN